MTEEGSNVYFEGKFLNYQVTPLTLPYAMWAWLDRRRNKRQVWGDILSSVTGTMDLHIPENFGRSIINTVDVIHEFPILSANSPAFPPSPQISAKPPVAQFVF